VVRQPLAQPEASDLGVIQLSPFARVVLSEPEVFVALSRHLQSMQSGGPLFSTRHSGRGVRFVVVTMPDRSATAVVLPEELSTNP
jgi:hypothetical protein